jgi:hypothetical protein
MGLSVSYPFEDGPRPKNLRFLTGEKIGPRPSLTAHERAELSTGALPTQFLEKKAGESLNELGAGRYDA